MADINNVADIIENEIRGILTGFPTIWLIYGTEGIDNLINEMLEHIFEMDYNDIETRNYITTTLNRIEKQLKFDLDPRPKGGKRRN